MIDAKHDGTEVVIVDGAGGELARLTPQQASRLANRANLAASKAAATELGQVTVGRLAEACWEALASRARRRR